ncbi:hypothetical protein BDV18DRAFT_130818 [Aspergillus unguis]
MTLHRTSPTPPPPPPTTTTTTPHSLGQGQHTTRDNSRPSTTPGYLGSTSFSAVFSEHRTDISFEEGACLTDSVFARANEQSRLESGLEVLRFLYTNDICAVLVRKFYAGHLMAVVSGVVIVAILGSMKRVFDSLETNGSANDVERRLQDLVRRIFKSSAHPLTSHADMSVEEYFASFTDENLRWEVIGIILATAGIALMSTSDSDTDLLKAAPDPQARDMLRTQIVEASGIVLSFCDTAASVNELLGFHQYNDMLLRTQYYGDTSYAAWRRLGDLTATIYAAGLHQESTRAQNYPPFLHQWRKMCFCAAFYADKSLSTFVGRPPFINYRYCTISAPLDLRDEDLIAGGEPLRRAMGKLDAGGWNHDSESLGRGGRLSMRVSMMRLRFLLSVLREQALEIALGVAAEGDMLAKYNKVIETAQTLWETCPANLRHDQAITKTNTSSPSEDDGGSNPLYPLSSSSSIAFARRHIYLDYLYTLFLVQRMVVKRTNTGQSALFNTSREVLSIILETTGERHPGVDISRHHSWIALYYGLPAASILAFELLRQTQEPGPHPPMPPRAEIIRNLSVFVSCLSWVAAPGQGNYRTCRAVERKLSDILDQILDPQPIQSQSQSQLDLNHGNILAAAPRDALGVGVLDGGDPYTAGAAGGLGYSGAAGLYGLMNWDSADSFDFDPFASGLSAEGFMF